MYLYWFYVHTLIYTCIDYLLVVPGDTYVGLVPLLLRVHHHWHRVDKGSRVILGGATNVGALTGGARGSFVRGVVRGDVVVIALDELERWLDVLTKGIDEQDIGGLID